MLEDSCCKSKHVSCLPGRTNNFFSTDTHAVFWLKQMKCELINSQKTKVKTIIVFFFLIYQCVSKIIVLQPCSLSCVTTSSVTNTPPGSCMAIVHPGP